MARWLNCWPLSLHGRPHVVTTAKSTCATTGCVGALLQSPFPWLPVVLKYTVNVFYCVLRTIVPQRWVKPCGTLTRLIVHVIGLIFDTSVLQSRSSAIAPALGQSRTFSTTPSVCSLHLCPAAASSAVTLDHLGFSTLGVYARSMRIEKDVDGLWNSCTAASAASTASTAPPVSSSLSQVKA